MPIEGRLRELALPDVVQLLHLSRKTGALTVRSEAYARPGLLHLDGGFLVGARSPGESSRLGRLLQVAGKATAAQVERALVEQRRVPGRRLGAILVESHGIAAGDVQRQLRFQVEETVFELARWTDGYFHFEEGEAFDGGPVRIRLSADSLLMEAMRRVDEWSALASGRPDTALVPRLVDLTGEAAPLLTLQPQEWEVLAGVDGERTLRSIARELGRAEFDVAKAVYGLVSAGVIELGARTARGSSARRVPQSGLAEVEAALGQGRLDEAEHRLDELAAADPESGALSLLRGRLEAHRGQWGPAVRCMETAIRQDPLLGDAYYHLGRAALRSGDLERAEECLNVFVRLPEADARRDVARRAATLLAELRSLLEGEE